MQLNNNQTDFFTWELISLSILKYYGNYLAAKKILKTFSKRSTKLWSKWEKFIKEYYKNYQPLIFEIIDMNEVHLNHLMADNFYQQWKIGFIIKSRKEFKFLEDFIWKCSKIEKINIFRIEVNTEEIQEISDCIQGTNSLCQTL